METQKKRLRNKLLTEAQDDVDASMTFEEMVDTLDLKGINVTVNTEFSSKTDGHGQQVNELARMIGSLSSKDSQVSLVGHSKGGLVGAMTVSYFAQMKCYYEQDFMKIKTAISVNTPYNTNYWAGVQMDLMIKYAAFIDGKEYDYLLDKDKAKYVKRFLGVAQLAGYDENFEPYDPSDRWNYQAVKNSGADVYALYSDWSKSGGDTIVMLPSQKGGKFAGFTDSGDNPNVFEIIDETTSDNVVIYQGQEYKTSRPNNLISHMNVMERTEAADMVAKLLSR